MLSFDEQLSQLITHALTEDIGDGDHSTLSSIPPDKKGSAILKIKQDGILAGVDIARYIFSYVEPGSVFHQHKADGDQIVYGDTAFTVDATIYTILQCERLVLNCMQRMSGIATLTHTYVEKIKSYRSKVLDTRKTTPNFRLLEKEAVRIGGGHNHRFGLYDMIMLKDNHIDYCGSIESALEKAKRYVTEVKPGLTIEIETRNVDEVRRVLAVGYADRIMLDNFTPDQITDALAIIKGSAETEASGGINLDNIVSYAATGVDYISIGALIHQAKSLDLSLKAIPTS